MIRNGIWVFLGWLSLICVSALARHFAPGYLHPDMVIVVVTFVAFHREPASFTLVAIILGYLVGAHTGAPLGLHEFSLAAVALILYLSSGRLAGGGALFFAAASAAGVIAYNLLLLVVLTLGGLAVGFSSLWTQALFPQALLVFLFAVVFFHPMSWLENRLTKKRYEGLQWN